VQLIKLCGCDTGDVLIATEPMLIGRGHRWRGDAEYRYQPVFTGPSPSGAIVDGCGAKECLLQQATRETVRLSVMAFDNLRSGDSPKPSSADSL
jgi:hypothetical protein